MNAKELLELTGGDAILAKIVTLISEGYGVAIMPAPKIIYGDGEEHHGFTVEIFDSLGDGYPVTKATDTRLTDAVAAAYQMVPVRE